MIYSVDSIIGNGQNFYEDGRLVGYSIDSLTGNGQNFYDASGKFVGYSVDALIGNGQNFYGVDGSRSYSMDGLLGGKIITGDHTGFGADSLFGGGTDYFVDSGKEPQDDIPSPFDFSSDSET